MTQWQPPDPTPGYGDQYPPVPAYPQAPQGYPQGPAGYPAAPPPYPAATPPGYPVAPPGYFAGYSATPGPQYSPYGPPPSPSGGTAITAAVLCFLGTVAHGLGTMMVFVGMSAVNDVPKAKDLLPGWYTTYAVSSALINVAISIALLVGGIQLLRHVGWSRMVVAGACAAAIVWRIVDLIATSSIYDGIEKYGVDTGERIGGMAGSAFALIFPIATLVLVLLPLTKRWCEVPQR